MLPADSPNPYSPPHAAGEAITNTSPLPSFWKCIATGGVVSILATFPLAALVALVYRFPVPFVGYVSGWGAWFRQ